MRQNIWLQASGLCVPRNKFLIIYSHASSLLFWQMTRFLLQAYDFTRILSSFYFKGYTSLTKIQRIEWNNRSVLCQSKYTYITHIPSFISETSCWWPIILVLGVCPAHMQFLSRLYHYILSCRLIFSPTASRDLLHSVIQ